MTVSSQKKQLLYVIQKLNNYCCTQYALPLFHLLQFSSLSPLSSPPILPSSPPPIIFPSPPLLPSSPPPLLFPSLLPSSLPLPLSPPLLFPSLLPSSSPLSSPPLFLFPSLLPSSPPLLPSSPPPLLPSSPPPLFPYSTPPLLSSSSYLTCIQIALHVPYATL